MKSNHQRSEDLYIHDEIGYISNEAALDALKQLNSTVARKQARIVITTSSPFEISKEHYDFLQKR